MSFFSRCQAGIKITDAVRINFNGPSLFFYDDIMDNMFNKTSCRILHFTIVTPYSPSEKVTILPFVVFEIVLEFLIVTFVIRHSKTIS